jgi:anti-sigma B factor antagonist
MAPLPDTSSMAEQSSSDVFGLQVAEHGLDARVVTVVGEIDALTATELATLLTMQLVVAQVVVVNLDGVRFLGSAGLSVLLEANELATREDRELRLVCNSRTANLALEVTGLQEQFTFAASVPDALKNVPDGLKNLS